MLSQEAELALDRLNEGAIMNSIHTIARELIEAGLARDSWHRLELTEAGRMKARRRFGQQLIVESEYMYEMSGEPPKPLPIYPFMPPEPEVPPEPVIEPLKDAPPPPVLPVPDYTRGLRAAGVATGMTGHNPDVTWVHAFVEAYIQE